jgi:2-hydroxycyclohexanecarboxyl-CoA dehydrogenase
MRLANKVAIVTGAASGIGKATARLMAREGAYVFLADINDEGGAAAAAEIRAAGLQGEFLHLDVTSSDSIKNFKQQVLARKSQVDILASVAGWGKQQPFIENTPDFWDKIIALNMMGPILLSRAFIEEMMARKYGKIVVVASDAGRVGSLGETVYAAAKGGAIAFCKSLAREAARFNINVNSVCPGPTDTPLMAAVPEKYHEAFIKATPLRRLARPEEIADAILFFSSDEASFVTGQVLSVSGGLVIPG